MATLFSECAIWLNGLWVALSARGRRMRDVHSVVRLQKLQYVFPRLGRRLCFRFLSKECLLRKDPACMNNLAVCYAKGLGCLVDPKKSFLWYKASSQAGCIYATHSLAGCYYNGFGTSVDDEAAFKLFYQAYLGGRNESACFLGLMYSRGEYVEKSAEKAFMWYRIGALLGDANSQYDLSKCFRYGEGCMKDVDLADIWLMVASKNDSSEAREDLLNERYKSCGYSEDEIE